MSSRGRGRGGGGRGQYKGPQLPATFVQEIGGGPVVLGAGGKKKADLGDGRFGIADRKQQRKAARAGRGQQRFEQQRSRQQLQRSQHKQGGHQQEQRGAPAALKRQPQDAEELSERPAAKRQYRSGLPGVSAAAAVSAAPDPQKPARPAARAAVAPASAPTLPAAAPARRPEAGRANSRFEELLSSDAGLDLGQGQGQGGAGGASGGSSWQRTNSREAFLEELRYQRQLEKRLGMHKRSKTKSKLAGPDDGLEDLVGGITAGTDQLLPTYMQSASDRAAVLKLMGGGDEEGSRSRRRGIENGDDGTLSSASGSGSGSDDDVSGSDGDEGEDGEDDSDEDDGMRGLLEDSLSGSGSGSGSDDEDAEDEGEADEGSSGEEDGGEDEDLSGSGGERSLADSDGEDGSEGSEDTPAGQSARRATGAAAGPGPRSDAGAVAGGGARYVPPALRAKLAAAAGGGDAATAQVERRITGLLNRLAESNLQAMVRDVANMYEQDGRRTVSAIVAQQILQAAAEGPRASEQFGAVAAAFVAGLAASASAPDVAAEFLGSLAAQLEAAYTRQDSLAQQNLANVLSYLYSSGVLGCELLFSFLDTLRERFCEADVVLMVTLLNAVGLQLRHDDPVAMKAWVLSVHTRAAQVGAAGGMSKRATLMLDLVVDIKNNRSSSSAGSGGRRGGALAVLSPTVARWLKQCGVDEVALRNLSWTKVLAPNKKGMWWLPAAGETEDQPLLRSMLPGAGGGLGAFGTAAVGGLSSADVAGDGNGADVASLLRLAAAQRMNTDARRAVFLAIMGSEDVVEAFDKLLRLPLKGEQEREVVRVLLDCCLHERAFNPYYALLAVRLCRHSRGHRMTLQFCVWDKLKEVSTLDLRPLAHLARLHAAIVGRFCLSLATLKVVDFYDLSAKDVLYWRVFFRHLLGDAKDGEEVSRLFDRLDPRAAAQLAATAAATQQRKKKRGGFDAEDAYGDEPEEVAVASIAALQQAPGVLLGGLMAFLRTSLGPWLASKEFLGKGGAAGKATPGTSSDNAQDVSDVLLRRLRTAERSLATAIAASSAV